MSQQSNIFDEAGRQSKPPVKAKGKSQAAHQAPSPFSWAEKKADVDLDQFDPSTMSFYDVQRMLEKVREMHDELDLKLDAIYQRAGWSPREIQNFLNNPNNFTLKQWETLQAQREVLLSSLRSDKDTRSSESSSSKKEQENIKANKERRGKMIGARRNWISMR